MRDDAPATKSGKKAARPGGKALIAATLGDRIGAKNGTVAGVRHIETAEEAVRQFVGNLEVVYQAAKKRKGSSPGPDSGTTGRTTGPSPWPTSWTCTPTAGPLCLPPCHQTWTGTTTSLADALAEFWSTDPVVDDEVRKLAKRLVSDLRFKGLQAPPTGRPDEARVEVDQAGRRSRGDTSPVRGSPTRRRVPSTPGRGRRCTRRRGRSPRNCGSTAAARWCLLVPSRGTGGSRQATSPRPCRSWTTRLGSTSIASSAKGSRSDPSTTTSLTPTTTADRAAMSPSTRTQPPPCSGHPTAT